MTFFQDASLGAVVKLGGVLRQITSSAHSSSLHPLTLAGEPSYLAPSCDLDFTIAVP
ncbi:MAG: hypothetical protein JOY67_19365 [Hyphomicrobiales bacterium]|nr:hypothetical protein [Hyphomicrobiales bacterium]MBV9517357.1 hypothetical protein [Hyphomicrobiales bacterium]